MEQPTLGRQVLTGLLVLLLTLCIGPLAVAAPLPGKSNRSVPPVAPLKIVAPDAGRTVNVGDRVDIQVWLRPDIDRKAQSVQLVCEGKSIGLLTAKPFTTTWDTTTLKEGRYIVEAYAFLASGNKVAAQPVEITVKSTAVLLPEGTPILVLTEEKMESGEIQTGATIRFKVDRDVLGQDGKVLVPAGATALGEVVKSEGSGFFGKSGVLDFAVRTVPAADGTTVPLRAARNAEGDDNTAGVIAGALLLSVFFVFLSGSDVEIPAGTLFTAYVARDTVIARPLAPRVDATTLAQERAVTMTTPTAGARVQRTDQMTFACLLTPPDGQAYLRLYMDDKLLLSQRGNPEKLEWRGREDLIPGEHTLYVEATYAMGRIVKSPPMRFLVVDE